MLREQFEELKHTGELPTPSGIGMRILVQTQDEDCSIDDVARTIQADPALTGRILKLASAAHNGGPPVATASEAAMRLGLRTVSNVALGFTLVAGNRQGRCRSFDYDLYWSTSLATGVAAQVVSQRLGIGVPAEAFTCGLLARIGLLALASVHPTDYAEVLDSLEEFPSETLAELERERFRVDHRELTAAMLKDWGLPPAYAVAAEAFGGEIDMSNLEEPGSYELVRLLNTATTLAEACVVDRDASHLCWSALEAVREEIDLEEEPFAALYREVVECWQEWGEMLEVPTTESCSLEDIRRQADEVEKRRTEEDEALDHGLRILAVDDDPISLRLLRRHLENEGHEVYTASNGEQALAVALKKNPQVVVTDWMMPVMDGLQLCKALRSYTDGRNMYVLLLTGRGEEDRIVEAFDAGVDDYIVKPFKPKLLLARIRAGRRVIRLQRRVEKDAVIRKRDLSKLTVLNRRLQEAALTDPLTDLANRRHAMKRLEMEWLHANRAGTELSVITIDIDHFKSVNDGHGHDVGDVVLTETSAAILRSLRRSDTAARMGGEEFLVICPSTDRKGALAMAERIRRSVEANLVEAGTYSGRVTVSLGVATRSAFVTGIDHLLKLGDEAVYVAKKEGRNRIAEPDPPTGEARSA